MQNFAPKFKNRYRVIDGKSSIELKLKTPHQLFDERDPSPFRERDLKDDAARYIYNSYLELPNERGAKLSLYFASLGGFEDNPDVIPKAIHSYFEYEAELKRRELRNTFKEGLVSLCLGLTFLLVYTVVSHTMGKPQGAGLLTSLSYEWLYLMVLVSMWKPIDIFLYEWWPIRREHKTHLELARLEIEIRDSEVQKRHEIVLDERMEPTQRIPLTNLKTS